MLAAISLLRGSPLRSIFGLTIVVGLLLWTGCDDEKKKPVQAISSKVSGIAVLEIKPEQVSQILELNGTVRSALVSVLSSKTMGRITSIKVREGDRVKKGDLLVTIDARQITAGAEGARANLKQAQFAVLEVTEALKSAEAGFKAAKADQELARATYQRFKALFNKGSVSAQEFDEVTARLKASSAQVESARHRIKALGAKKSQVLAMQEAAEAALANAEALFDYVRITSPLDGLVTAKHAEVGQLATPGMPIVTVEDDLHYRLEVPVQESYLKSLSKGDLVPLYFNEVSKPLSGRIAEIVPAIDPATRTATVKIDLPEKSPPLRSGAWGRARFSIGQKTAIFVPEQAVLKRGHLTGVFVVDPSSTARYRLIRLGEKRGNRFEVLSGLFPGDRIALNIPPGLRDGTKVIFD